ncbi:YceG-like family protein [Terribacillus halophilus]|uniref:YceG-like family protein n=1 Tax=Terribacillus halophilus TaxID=361279 RepID=A0A1G6SWB1_9BACI|nr:endolytic transglycosylase MltG [Terribacillus halophilus]SDD20435.1 YceG-like family protein [Terribacillus halophilus]
MKQVIQGFATALLLAGAIMIVLHYTDTASPETEKTAKAAVETIKPDAEEMKKELEDVGYHVLKNEDYEELKQKQTVAPAETEQEQKPKSFTLKLESGMTSEEVASELEQAGIIEDASAFRTYLDVTEASESLQVGKYDVNSDMDYDDIVELMTK